MYLDVHDMLSLTKNIQRKWHVLHLGLPYFSTAYFSGVELNLALAIIFESLELAVDSETTLYVPDPFR